MPTDGTRAANMGTGDFGTSPIFVQLSDKQLACHYLCYVGIGKQRTMADRKKCAGLALLWQIRGGRDSHMWNDPAVKGSLFLC